MAGIMKSDKFYKRENGSIGRKFPPVSQEQRILRSENMKRIWKERKQHANAM